MEILVFARTIYQKNLRLLKYHRKEVTTGSVDHVVLVQRDNGEKVCWFWDDSGCGFVNGVYGDKAEKAFEERTKVPERPFVTKTIDLTKPCENTISQGGFPVGNIARLVGPPSSGKSAFDTLLERVGKTSDIRFPSAVAVVKQEPAALPQHGPGMPNLSAGACRKFTKAKINQALREIEILEDIPGKYRLGVYTMPAGRAFLCRVYPKFEADYPPTMPANKKERDRHAKAVLSFQLEAAYELLDAADEKRGRMTQMRYRAEARRLIERTEKELKDLAANS